MDIKLAIGALHLEGIEDSQGFEEDVKKEVARMLEKRAATGTSLRSRYHPSLNVDVSGSRKEKVEQIAQAIMALM